MNCSRTWAAQGYKPDWMRCTCRLLWASLQGAALFDAEAQCVRKCRHRYGTGGWGQFQTVGQLFCQLSCLAWCETCLAVGLHFHVRNSGVETCMLQGGTLHATGICAV